MRIGIDLLWVRHRVNGGTESFIRNLMHGFGKYGANDEFVLFLSEDNILSFGEYRKYKNFEFKECKICSANRFKRTIWERININREIKLNRLDVFFSPIYSIPGKLNIPTVAVIHDLQAIHFPEYFSWARNQYMYYNWSYTCKNADLIISISDYCRKDIISHYNINPDKIKTIYNPIIGKSTEEFITDIYTRFDVKKGRYYYAVSSTAKHKNLMTLLKAFTEIVKDDSKEKMLITGVKGNVANDIHEYIKKMRIGENVLFTGFVTNEERDALYTGARLFVYPSIFEGFGMPPIEAMLSHVPVLTTRCTSLEEVTMGKCNYVDNPYCPKEWKDKMIGKLTVPTEDDLNSIRKRYSLERIAAMYIDCFHAAVS